MNIPKRNKIIPIIRQSKRTYRCVVSEFSKERHAKIDTAVFKNKQYNWQKKINNLPSIEQRIVELNMPKLNRYKATVFKDSDIPFNGLKFVKFATKTHIEKSLPIDFYCEDAYVEEICKELEDEVKESILVDLAINHKRPDQFFSNINMMLNRKLQKDSSHLKSSITDYEPTIHAFWYVDHPDLPPSFTTFLGKMKLPKESYTSHKSFKSQVQPNIVLRTAMPLPAAVDLESDLCCGQEIEFCKYQPDAFGFQKEEKRAVILPGYFPGVKNEHGHVFFYNLNSIDEFRSKFGDAFLSLAHQQRAVNVGFTQAYSHAFFQGATPFRDPARPVTQQTVFSDGKLWVFSVYQLNRCNFNLHEDNNHNNIAWLQDPVQLFDTVEDNKVMGYNSDVLKTLVKMYMKKPEIVPEPDKSRFLMNFDASEEFKNEFHRLFRRLISEGRFYGRKEREIAMWEYIYKIKHQTRPRDAKRKFYEVPWRNTPNHLAKINDIYPRYIPRKKRVHPLIFRQPRLNTETLLKYDSFAVAKTYSRDWDLLKTTIGVKQIEDPLGDPYLLRDY